MKPGQMKKIIIPILLTLTSIILLAGCLSDTPAENGDQSLGKKSNQEKFIPDWKEIETEISYTELRVMNPGNDDTVKDLVIVKIDPKKYALSVYQNINSENAKNIKEIHRDTHSLVTFNGNYYTEDFKPTGLLISNGEKIRDVSNASLVNGIMAIDKNGNVKLLDQNSKINEDKYEFAIQNGPVLIDSKGSIQINEDDGNRASRTILGLDKDKNLILIILKQNLLNTDNSISLYNLAHLLKEAPELKKMELNSVLNLDGGSSTGLMINEIYYAEMEKVQNAILVKER